MRRTSANGSFRVARRGFTTAFPANDDNAVIMEMGRLNTWRLGTRQNTTKSFVEKFSCAIVKFVSNKNIKTFNATYLRSVLKVNFILSGMARSSCYACRFEVRIF